MPAGARRVASALAIGLDESATVWLDPPVESGADRRFVVLLPDRGVALLAICELDPAGLLGAVRGRLRVVVEGREIERASPAAAAEGAARALAAAVASESRLAGVEVPVAAGVAFPLLRRGQAEERGLAGALDLERSLFAEEVEAALAGTGETGLLRAFARILGAPPLDPVSRSAEDVLRALIQPDAVVRRPRRNGHTPLTIFRPPEGEDDPLLVLDRRQEALARALGEGHRVVRGVAGSGKTLVLVARARLLARAQPTARILVTCFTRSLAGDLRAQLADVPSVEVVHLDRLMADAIRAAGLPHPGYDDPSGDGVARLALRALERGAGRRYRAVHVDEAQDFSTEALRFAVGLLEEGHDDLLVVADAAQRIFRRSASWRQAGIQAQGRSRVLRRNYRNTRETLAFASAFLGTQAAADAEDENAVVPPEAAERSGEAPLLRIVPDVRAEVAAAVTQATRWAAEAPGPRSVAVLYSGEKEDGTSRPREIRAGLARAGVPVFWLNDPEDRDARDRLAGETAPVVLATVHSAKGLEFPSVVLAGLARADTDPEAARRTAYVGMTRAMSRLAVIVTAAHPLARDLGTALEALFPV